MQWAVWVSELDMLFCFDNVGGGHNGMENRKIKDPGVYIEFT